MKWTTRSNVKVDRVACPWLIRRFIDPQAKFLFVAEDSVSDHDRWRSVLSAFCKKPPGEGIRARTGTTFDSCSGGSRSAAFQRVEIGKLFEEIMGGLTCETKDCTFSG